MDIDWDTLMFVGIWLGLFLVLPICAYLVIKRLFSGRKRRLIINILGTCGILIAVFMAAYPFVNPATQPGGLAIIILVPLGGLLGLTCAGLLWRNNQLR